MFVTLSSGKFQSEFTKSWYSIWRMCRRITVLEKISERAGRSGDRILMGARFPAPVQTGTGAHLVFYTMSTGSFAGVKRSGCGV